MTSKEKYQVFCESTYVPIFSKPWWMDAVCRPENWDVWLYSTGDQLQDIEAAMPYYVEQRGPYRYITKPPLTQNNGILFKKNDRRKAVSQAELEEKIIDAACTYISGLGVDVYEQQFHHSFKNWQPFFWHNYTNILRYTYIIRDTLDMTAVTDAFSANYRKNIRKGQRLTQISSDISPETFYDEHDRIFRKQGLPSPVSRAFWLRLYHACIQHQSGQLLCARDTGGNLHSLIFLVWDEAAMYPLLGGYMPEFSNSQSYPALTYHSIAMAGERGLSYDFEGSMIHRIAVSFRQFGGTPTPYYRIRKVFNPEIVRKEAEDYIQRLEAERAPLVNEETPPLCARSENT